MCRRSGERELHVIGPSGSGKSLQVAAGLLPRHPSASLRFANAQVAALEAHRKAAAH